MRVAVVFAAVVLTACTAASPSTATPQDGRSPKATPAAATATPRPTPETAGGAGSVWRRLQLAPGPPEREDHTWTLSGDGAIAYLFGGRATDGTVFDDLWAFDLRREKWTRVDAPGPAPRFGHNAVWVDGRGLVVYAGQGPSGFHDDLWAFDPVLGRWTRLSDAGAKPLARYGSCAALGPDGRLWISHGFTSDGSRFSDTRAYDFGRGAWVDETPASYRPIERCLHACWWTADDRLALFGGQTTGVPALGDLWHLSIGNERGAAWHAADADGRLPAARQLYASTRWETTTVVFGGGSIDGGFLADVWLIDDDGSAMRLAAGEGPPARSGAELIADGAAGRVLLFGGRNRDGALNDLWELTLPATR